MISSFLCMKQSKNNVLHIGFIAFVEIFHTIEAQSIIKAFLAICIGMQHSHLRQVATIVCECCMRDDCNYQHCVVVIYTLYYMVKSKVEVDKCNKSGNGLFFQLCTMPVDRNQIINKINNKKCFITSLIPSFDLVVAQHFYVIIKM